MNNQQELLELLREGPVSPLRAWVEIGCYRVSDAVERLRKKGYVIDTVSTEHTTTRGKVVHFGVYHLIAEPHNVIDATLAAVGIHIP